jgi:predicted flavoprotein YhiN
VTGPRSFDHAEVTIGGIRTGEVDPQTLESRLVPGLYLAGEILDVHGDLGGYNLQWAWSSGWVAGQGRAA